MGHIGNLVEEGKFYPRVLLVKFKDITHVNTVEDLEIVLELLEDAIKPPHCNEIVWLGESISRIVA